VLNMRYSCHFKEEHVILEDSPVSNDVYQPESLDTALPFLSSEINYVVGVTNPLTTYLISEDIKGRAVSRDSG
jgi:hypothetical protein